MNDTKPYEPQFKRGKKAKKDSPIEVLTRAYRLCVDEIGTAQRRRDRDSAFRLQTLGLDIHRAIRLLESKPYQPTALSAVEKCLVVVGGAVSFVAIWYIIIRGIFG